MSDGEEVGLGEVMMMMEVMMSAVTMMTDDGDVGAAMCDHDDDGRN